MGLGAGLSRIDEGAVRSLDSMEGGVGGTVAAGGTAPTVEGVATSSTATISLTVTDGNLAIVVMGTEASSSETHDSVTRNGQAFTKISEASHNSGGADVLTSIWYRLSPSVGTYDVTVVTSGPSSNDGNVAYSIIGGGTPQAGVGTDTGTTSPRTATFDVDDDDSLILDGLSSGYHYEAITVDGDQTEHANINASSKFRLCSSTKVADSGSQSMEWTADDTVFSFRCSHIAVAIPPS